MMIGGPSFNLSVEDNLVDELFSAIVEAEPAMPLLEDLEPPSMPVMNFSFGDAVHFDDEYLQTTYRAIDGAFMEGDAQMEELGKQLAQKKTHKKKQGKVTVEAQGEGSGEFHARDEHFATIVEAGGENPSASVDQWALNRLRKFQNFVGMDNVKELVQYSAQEGVALLCQFFEQVKKRNGKYYPSETLMSLLRAFNRVIKKDQERRIMSTGIDEIPFNMKTSPMWRRVCVACCLAMARSKDGGANQPRKKSKVVTYQDEATALADACMAKTSSKPLQRRVGFYCNFRLSIRGKGELRNTLQNSFRFGTDGGGRYMHFDETLSTKTSRPTMKKHMPEHFRKPVKTYEVDVVHTFEAYFDRLPAGMDELFLMPIPNPGSRIWYAKSVVGETTLDHLVNFVLLESGVFSPDEVVEGGQNVTNKSGRTTMITRMCEMGVPNEVGMLLSGHKSRGAYKRYDQSSDVRVRAAQRCAAEPICYEDALEEERAKMKWMIFGKEGVQHIDAVKDIDEDVSPNKKPKVVPVMAHPKGEVIDTNEDQKGKEIVKRDQMPEPVMKMRRDLQKDDMEFLEKFDWEADYKEWFADRCLAINPINALIGRLGEGCTVNLTINGGLNFKN